MARKSGSRRVGPSPTDDPKNLCENCYEQPQLRETMAVPPWFFNHSVRISPQIRQWQTIDLEASESKQERRVLEMAYSTVINHQAKLFNDPIVEAGLSPEDLLNHIRLAIGSMGGRAKISFTIERPDEQAVTASAVVSDDAQSLIHPGPEAAKALSTLLPKRNHPVPAIYQVPSQTPAAAGPSRTATAEAAGRKDSVHSSHPPHVAKPVTPPSSDGSKSTSSTAVPAAAPSASFVSTFPAAPAPTSAFSNAVSSSSSALPVPSSASATIPSFPTASSSTPTFVPPFPAAASTTQQSDGTPFGLLAPKPRSAAFIPYIPSQPSRRQSLIVKLPLSGHPTPSRPSGHPTTSRPSSPGTFTGAPFVSSPVASDNKRKRDDADDDADEDAQPKPRRRKVTLVDERWDWAPIASDEDEGDHEEGVRRLMSTKHSEERGGRMMRERKGTSYRED